MFGDLYGPDVNLTEQHLVAAAEPETVVVSRRTADGAPTFLFEALPARPLKGFPDSITPYLLLFLRSRGRRGADGGGGAPVAGPCRYGKRSVNTRRREFERVLLMAIGRP